MRWAALLALCAGCASTAQRPWPTAANVVVSPMRPSCPDLGEIEAPTEGGLRVQAARLGGDYVVLVGEDRARLYAYSYGWNVISNKGTPRRILIGRALRCAPR